MADERVRAEWNDYAAEVVPADAPPVQLQECRRAFYAGAWAVLQLLLSAPDDVSDDEQDTYLVGLLEECLAFKNSVGTPAEGQPAKESRS